MLDAAMPTNPYGILPRARWRVTTLGELTEEGKGFIQTGPFGSQLHAHDYRAEGTPVVMPQQLGDNEIVLSGIARISDGDRDRLSRHVMEEGDIVFSRRGDVTRRAYIGPNEAGWLCGTGCMLIRIRHQQCDNRYLAYFFSLPQVKSYIAAKAVGATMPNLNQGILKRVPVMLPPPPTQERIVAMLLAYDKLIANNRRRMELLEEATRQLYQEWFVRLQFPGCEHIPTVHGVPKGWEKKTLANICESVDYGYTASAEQEAVGPKFFLITDIVPDFIDWASVPHCRIDDDKCARVRLQEGDIVVAHGRDGRLRQTAS